MDEKLLLLGDEAIALGAIHAGLSGVYAYPGTPSTEITEYIQGNPMAAERKIHCRWSANEKTAMEAALGMSYMGKRAMVCMKHVGMNVCADAFVNSAMTGTNGGLVVVAADDPSMHSSQNEQDSRFYGKFAMVPVFEPSSQQEVYGMMKDAFELSERYKLPVVLRMVTRMAHSRAVVETAEVREPNAMTYPDNPKDWVLLPAVARKRNVRLVGLQKDLLQEAENSKYNKLIDGKDKSLGIIACGIAYNYLMEHFKDGCPYPVLKVSQYPLPVNRVKELAEMCDSLLVLEDGQPVVEEMLRGVLDQNITIKGRLTGEVPRTGELTPDNIIAALGLKDEEVFPPCELVVPRPPALCQGCGHRFMFEALNNVLKEYDNSRVFGDIGCYTLGYLPPYQALHSVVDMGASITMAKGAADAGQFPSVAVIGDSTFTHSGMTGLLDAVNEKTNMVVVISDNLTTGMTGGQDSAGTGRIENICRGIGVEPEHVRVVVPLPQNMEEMQNVIREEINYNGVSVVIPRRECIQTARRHNKKK
ncbi:thiamine pyrophosphate-dependent enzyme [uncultured Prevotella sp.]|uniref:thiamine pyrophosphate-dependent enzyme n=1 Tax=uncultured Prevotella sp. TaxID=159272 RepID=UPI002624C8D1|nr:thiamine pyrophosphate-dependent enzyme [uncultured Prevotella sp.]